MCFTSSDMRGRGDSGGPLVSKYKREFVQIGIVSYGGDCNNTLPEVYSRISAYYKWRRMHMSSIRRRLLEMKETKKEKQKKNK